MDAVDMAILEEMTSPEAMLFGGLNPRLSPEAMSKRVKLDPSTIRARMRNWQETGFLKAWHILPNPAVMGLHHIVSYLDAPNVTTRAEVLAAASATDGVVCAFEHVSGPIGLGFFAESDAVVQRRVSLLTRMPGVTAGTHYGKLTAAGSQNALSTTELKVLGALRQDPTASMAGIASGAGVSQNTASARYNAMVRRAALWAAAELDFTKFTGGVLVRLFLDLDGTKTPRKAIDELEAAFRPMTFFRATAPAQPNGPEGAHAMVNLHSIGEMDDVEALARGLDGVRDVRFLMPRAFHVPDVWLNETLAGLTPLETPSSKRP